VARSCATLPQVYYGKHPKRLDIYSEMESTYETPINLWGKHIPYFKMCSSILHKKT